MATFEELLSQAYGNVLKAGEAITSPDYMKTNPVPVGNVAGVSDAVSQATGLVSNAATSMPDYFNMGVGALQGANAAIGNAMTTAGQTTGAYDPQSYQQFMNPYQSQVIDEYTKEMQRQFNISGQNRAARAIGAGAFGGGREGVVEAEAQRGFQDQLGRGLAGLLSSGYGQAQQQAQKTFEDQRRAQQNLAATQLSGADASRGIGQMFGQFGVNAPAATGSLASTLSSLGITEQQAQQAQFDQQNKNQLARFMQPYQALQFQSGLIGQFPTLGATPQQMGNPLLAGIGAFGRQAF
tara:strand:+ start:856 stop:1740 length:885 start_codon:yes stop_codon:yes gene_type:complete